MNVANIKSQWSQIQGSDGGAAVGLDMFIRYFSAHPDVKSNVFHYSEDASALSGNAKLQAHGRKVMAQVGTAVAEIDDGAKMTATLKALGVRHKAFGDIKASYFDDMGPHLIAAMAARVPGLDKASWSAAYKAIADAILSGIRS